MSCNREDSDSSDDDTPIPNKDANVLTAITTAQFDIIKAICDRFSSVNPNKELSGEAFVEVFSKYSHYLCKILATPTDRDSDDNSDDEDIVFTKKTLKVIDAFVLARKDVITIISDQYQKLFSKNLKENDISSIACSYHDYLAKRFKQQMNANKDDEHSKSHAINNISNRDDTMSVLDMRHNGESRIIEDNSLVDREEEELKKSSTDTMSSTPLPTIERWCDTDRSISTPCLQNDPSHVIAPMMESVRMSSNSNVNNVCDEKNEVDMEEINNYVKKKERSINDPDIKYFAEEMIRNASTKWYRDKEGISLSELIGDDITTPLIEDFALMKLESDPTLKTLFITERCRGGPLCYLRDLYEDKRYKYLNKEDNEKCGDDMKKKMMMKDDKLMNMKVVEGIDYVKNVQFFDTTNTTIQLSKSSMGIFSHPHCFNIMMNDRSYIALKQMKELERRNMEHLRIEYNDIDEGMAVVLKDRDGRYNRGIIEKKSTKEYINCYLVDEGFQCDLSYDLIYRMPIFNENPFGVAMKCSLNIPKPNCNKFDSSIIEYTSNTLSNVIPTGLVLMKIINFDYTTKMYTIDLLNNGFSLCEELKSMYKSTDHDRCTPLPCASTISNLPSIPPSQPSLMANEMDTNINDEVKITSKENDKNDIPTIRTTSSNTVIDDPSLNIPTISYSLPTEVNEIVHSNELLEIPQRESHPSFLRVVPQSTPISSITLSTSNYSSNRPLVQIIEDD